MKLNFDTTLVIIGRLRARTFESSNSAARSALCAIADELEEELGLTAKEGTCSLTVNWQPPPTR